MINEVDFEEGTEGIVLSCAGRFARLSGAGDRASDFSDTLAEMDGEANGWRAGGSSRITMLRRWRWERRFAQHYQDENGFDQSVTELSFKAEDERTEQREFRS